MNKVANFKQVILVLVFTLMKDEQTSFVNRKADGWLDTLTELKYKMSERFRRMNVENIQANEPLADGVKKSRLKL